jgi:hypothetical protein
MNFDFPAPVTKKEEPKKQGLTGGLIPMPLSASKGKLDLDIDLNDILLSSDSDDAPKRKTSKCSFIKLI